MFGPVQQHVVAGLKGEFASELFRRQLNDDVIRGCLQDDNVVRRSHGSFQCAGRRDFDDHAVSFVDNNVVNHRWWKCGECHVISAFTKPHLATNGA